MIRYQLGLLFLFLSIFISSGQEYELGLNLGGGNYIGDIGGENYINPNKIGGGIVYKRTVNQWYSFRMNLNYFQLEAFDSDSDSAGRRARDFSVTSTIFNFSLGVEYNFIPRNPYLPLRSIKKITPYVYTGIGLGTYSGRLEFNNPVLIESGVKFNGTKLSIPVILGLKYRVTRHFIISLESGFNYYFTDNLDGTHSFYGNEERLIINGYTPTTNPNSNDWYTFSSIGLIYSFGDLSCYFNL